MYSKEELIEIQEKLKKKIILNDVLPQKIKTIAGVDQAFLDDRIISAIVVCETPFMNVLEKKYVIDKIDFPYIPGFLSFREGPSIIKVFKKLRNKPDVLLVDGNGILHTRGIGLASHVAILLDVSTIGIAKSLLCGKFKKVKRVGSYSPVIYGGKTIGYAYKSKEKCKSIFISPGHKISLNTSIKIVKGCIREYKLPIPLRLAHVYANEIKMKLS